MLIAVNTRANGPSETNLSLAAGNEPNQIMPVIINFSAQTSSAATQVGRGDLNTLKQSWQC